jgi:phosphorylcholine metabolism protein LicD
MTTKEQAVINLREIKEILDELGVVFWLDGGTLLGAYRDKDFCEDDEDDIDLCTWDNYLFLMDEIIAKAQEKGFIIHHRWELEVALKKNGSKIDLFFNRKNKKDAFTHLYDGDRIAKYVVIPVKYYEVLKPLVFQGMVFFAPSPIEDFLTLKYGNWKEKVHRKQYLCTNADQNKLVRDKYDI